ncbi:Cysteine proteinases superfamily protein [Melia azedarach]|uniref:Cysteine proteinases superfamily protein n=1 Tax=Melia azedarach TaxID=155640 RepID=A0ACC1XQU4_MELAZ|nr:Cysteine proteinases superfamily protein [Melia azedarach]
MIGQPRSWSQYGPAYHIRPLKPVPIDIYSQFLWWVATPTAYTEGETCRLTPTWISVVFEVGRWLEDEHISEYISLLSHRQLACKEMIPQHWTVASPHLYEDIAHGDDVLDTAIQPLCIYIPYLLDQTEFYRYRTDVIQSLEAFTYIRPIEGIPHQQLDSGDYGIFTCMFIQHLGLGLPLCFRAEDSELMRTRVAVDL